MRNSQFMALMFVLWGIGSFVDPWHHEYWGATFMLAASVFVIPSWFGILDSIATWAEHRRQSPSSNRGERT